MTLRRALLPLLLLAAALALFLAVQNVATRPTSGPDLDVDVPAAGAPQDVGRDDADRPTLAGGSTRRAASERAGGPAADLGPTVEWHGRVLTQETRAPIAGASVRASLGSDDPYRVIDPDPTAPRTDAEGRFSIGLIAAARGVLASADGFCARHVMLEAPEVEIVILLPKASGRILGTVKDPAGRPVGDAIVQAGALWNGYTVARTAADGSFTLPRPPVARIPFSVSPQRLMVGAMAVGFGTSWVEVPPAGADGDARVVITLGGGGTVLGRVLDAETGRAIEGARIVEGSGPAGEFLTAADGTFTFERAGPSGDVSAIAPGYALGKGSPETDAAGVVRVEIRIAKFVSFSGVVLDETGTPVAGAQVVAWRGKRATTSDQGTFTVEGPPQESASRPAVLGARGGEKTPAFVLVEGDKRDGIELRLGAPALVTGVVVDGKGAPVITARMRLDLYGGGAIPGIPAGVREIFPMPSGWAYGVNAEGRIKISGLAEATYAITIKPQAGDTTWTVQTQVGVVAGKPVEVKIVLDGAVRVVGRVVDEEGKPVAGAAVEARVRGRSSEPVTTDADGTFTIDGLPDAPIDLTASKPPEFDGLQVRVDPKDESIVLKFKRKAPVARLRLRFSGQKPERGEVPFVWFVSDGYGNQGDAVRDGDDVVTSPALPEWEGTLRVNFDTAYGFAEGVHPERGRETVVAVTLLPTLVISGTVTGDDGKPIEWAFLQLEPQERSSAFSRNARTAAGGSFQLKGLPPGRYRLAVWRDGLGRESLEVDAGATGLKIVLHPEAAITGKVRVGNRPADGTLRVEVRPGGTTRIDGSSTYTAACDEAGAFRFKVASGAWTLNAFDGTQHGPDLDVTVNAGETRSGVVLELPELRGLTIEGRVVREDGTGVPGVRIFAYPVPPGGTVAMASTSADGRFEVRGLASGIWRIDALPTSGLAAAGKPEVAAGSRGVVLTLSSTTSVRGRLVLPAGSDPAGASVVLGETGGLRQYTPGNVTSGGSFLIEGILAGTYRLSAHLGRFVGEAGAWIVVESGVPVVDASIEMREGATLAGRVEDTAGRALSGLRVHVEGTSPPAFYETKTATDGSFRVEGLFPGKHRVIVAEDGLRTVLSNTSVDVPPRGSPPETKIVANPARGR